MAEAWSWSQLSEHAITEEDRENGPANSQATLRLFGTDESEIRVTLYRDHHAWCPYCQKIWLWLEFKRVPYRIRKVTMRCYGQKEPWFLRKVPSGMLPALELDNRLITESDEILLALEQSFGPLGLPMTSPQAMDLRRLERLLFRAWCIWLCTPGLNKHQQQQGRQQFQDIARRFEQALERTAGPWLDPQEAPGTVDLVFVPYVERMNASLAYYKGYLLREEHPAIDRWFRALEARDTYRGTQSDFHTHVHDLPPQMGGCWSDANPTAAELSARIDAGFGLDEQEACWPEEARNSDLMRSRALSRVLKHRRNILNVNPLGTERFDQPLRAALTTMMSGSPCRPTSGSGRSLRYLRDRISVPRDMPLPAARLLRKALETTANLDNSDRPRPISSTDRYDQDPRKFND